MYYHVLKGSHVHDCGYIIIMPGSPRALITWQTTFMARGRWLRVKDWLCFQMTLLKCQAHVILDCCFRHKHEMWGVILGLISMKCGEFSTVPPPKASYTLWLKSFWVYLSFPVLVFEYFYMKFPLLNKNSKERSGDKGPWNKSEGSVRLLDYGKLRKEWCISILFKDSFIERECVLTMLFY